MVWQRDGAPGTDVIFNCDGTQVMLSDANAMVPQYRVHFCTPLLNDRRPADLYRWSLSPAADVGATRIFTASTHAADGWAEALDSAINADPRTRDSVWVRTALVCLADSRVLDSVTPRTGESFDPAQFLASSGVYLLGTSAGASAAANLIGAYLEDVAEVAREVAAASPGARLDPPLAPVVDEVANYPRPSLPSLMSEGGGSGITTGAVLQSLAQARAKFGEGGAIPERREALPRQMPQRATANGYHAKLDDLAGGSQYFSVEVRVRHPLFGRS